jgi:predicted anti-sigma-YlaC factor YlaD
MKRCELVLDHLDAVLAGTVSDELATHLAGCADCQRAAERARGLAEGERVLAAVTAPEGLRRRLKDLLRLAPACESAIERLGAALDGDLTEGARGELLEHMHSCPSCQAVWEAFATLHDVGANTRPSATLRAALALPPHRRLAARRRTRRFFDLRLATAAAYLLAALTVMLLSNPETVARESTYQMDRAATYASAVVQNRVQSYSERVSAALADAEGWLRDHAQDVWRKARSIFGAKNANRKPSNDVVRDGGRS